MTIRPLTTFSALAALLLCLGGRNPESRVVSISLAEIWALDMPGTRPMIAVMTGDGQYTAPEGELVSKIMTLINDRRRQHEDAGPAFAVPGEGLVALKRVYERLASGEAKPQVFKSDEPLSIFFFSKHYGAYVHLTHAEVSASEVWLTYTLVPHRTKQTTSHIALVPVRPSRGGKLKILVKAKVPERVDKRIPTWRQTAGRIVCKSSSITIQKTLPRSTPRASLIPLEEIWALDMPGTRPMDRRQSVNGYISPEGELVDRVRKLINKHNPWRDEADPAFAVRGEGLPALRQVVEILGGKRQPLQFFKKGEQISVVFLSKNYGAYVHLTKARVSDHRVELAFTLVPHVTNEVTSHMALIAFRPTTVGPVHIEISPDILETTIPRLVPESRELRHVVFGSFSVMITE